MYFVNFLGWNDLLGVPSIPSTSAKSTNATN